MTLLDLLEEKGVRSTAQLAEALGTNVDMIQARLERYEQLGYVRKTVMNADCGGNCKKCHGCSGIRNSAASVVYWERVKKS